MASEVEGWGMTCRQIDQFLQSEESRIRSINAHPSNPNFAHNFHVSAGSGVTVSGLGVIRAGSGRKRVVTSEFPEGGDPRFRAILAEMLRLHISKSNDYGTGADIYANYRSAEAIGIPAWKSCFVRALEKVQRLSNAFSGKKLNHEGVSDSFLDLANHIVISKVLYDEANPEG